MDDDTLALMGAILFVLGIVVAWAVHKAPPGWFIVLLASLAAVGWIQAAIGPWLGDDQWSLLLILFAAQGGVMLFAPRRRSKNAPDAGSA